MKNSALANLDNDALVERFIVAAKQMGPAVLELRDTESK